MVEGYLLDFTKRVKDIITQVVLTNQSKQLEFLNVVQQEVLENLVLERTDVKVLFDGGFARAQRKRAIIAPSYMTHDMIDTNVSLYQIEVIESRKITHSQIMGSLLGLSIDRSVIGDIMVKDDIAYFASCSEFEEFLQENFTKIGLYNIRLKLIEGIVIYEQKFEEIEIIVPSMRLDVIVKALTNTSRSKAEGYLDDGFIRLNHMTEKKPSRICNMGDVLSIRRHGRYTLDRIKKTTKNKKLVCIVKKSI